MVDKFKIWRDGKKENLKEKYKGKLIIQGISIEDFDLAKRIMKRNYDKSLLYKTKSFGEILMEKSIKLLFLAHLVAFCCWLISIIILCILWVKEVI